MFNRNKEFYTYFYGAPDQMTFVTTKPLTITGVALCRLSLRDESVIFEEAPLYANDSNYTNPSLETKERHETVLFSNVKGMNLEYFQGGKKTRHPQGGAADFGQKWFFWTRTSNNGNFITGFMPILMTKSYWSRHCMSPLKSSRRGSVLIIVLILMMVSVSLALYTVSVSRDIVTTSGQLMDNLQARLESGSVLEKLKYIGGTGRFSSWNLANSSASKEFPLQLNLRSAPIQVGNSELRLQDGAGKLGLWPPNTYMLKKLLLANGIKSMEAAVAADSLLDWIDEDDFKHLNGAETYYYRSEKSLAYGPRNDKFIQTLAELELIRGVPGRGI